MFPALALLATALQDPGGPEITVYNQNLALVKEVRTLDLKSGRQSIEIKDVPSMIQPSSVGFKSLSDPGSLNVLEQNYRYDLISPAAILNKSVGQKIRIIRTVANQRDVLEGTLLRSPYYRPRLADGSEDYGGMVIRTDDGRIILDPTGEVDVMSVPSGLISVPTLVWDLESAKAGSNQVELSYLTEGMNWTADYVLTLDSESMANLQGWVTIDNQSGASWENARLKLLAGDLNRAAKEQPMAMGGFGGGGGYAERRPQFNEQSLFEYHLYTLQRPASIHNNETKQISLLDGNGVPFTKKIIVDALQDKAALFPDDDAVGTGPIDVQVKLEFTNDEASHLGMPLPKGNIRVYQRDSSGSVQMIGEDTINHTPRNEHVSIRVGKSFDVVATRTRTDFKRIATGDVRESFEVELRNRSQQKETVHVYERLLGDWKILKSNIPYTKLDSNTVDFVVTLKPNEVQDVDYTAETKW